MVIRVRVLGQVVHDRAHRLAVDPPAARGDAQLLIEGVEESRRVRCSTIIAATTSWLGFFFGVVICCSSSRPI
jgi:hypothetical protein